MVSMHNGDSNVILIIYIYVYVYIYILKKEQFIRKTTQLNCVVGVVGKSPYFANHFIMLF